MFRSTLIHHVAVPMKSVNFTLQEKTHKDSGFAQNSVLCSFCFRDHNDLLVKDGTSAHHPSNSYSPKTNVLPLEGRGYQHILSAGFPL